MKSVWCPIKYDGVVYDFINDSILVASMSGVEGKGYLRSQNLALLNLKPNERLLHTVTIDCYNINEPCC